MKFAAVFVFAAALAQFASALPYYSGPDCGCGYPVQTVQTIQTIPAPVAAPQVFSAPIVTAPSCEQYRPVYVEQQIPQPAPPTILVEQPATQVLIEEVVRPVEVSVEPIIQVLPSPDLNVVERATYNPSASSSSYTVLNLAIPSAQPLVETVVIPQPEHETIIVEQSPAVVYQPAPTCETAPVVVAPEVVTPTPVYQEVFYQQAPVCPEPVYPQPQPVIYQPVVQELFYQPTAPVVYQPTCAQDIVYPQPHHNIVYQTAPSYQTDVIYQPIYQPATDVVYPAPVYQPTYQTAPVYQPTAVYQPTYQTTYQPTYQPDVVAPAPCGAPCGARFY